VALDMGYGLGSVMIRRVSESGVKPKEIEAAGLLFMRALGLSESEALRISGLPFPDMPTVALRHAVIDSFSAT
jgi:hypothetical protein